MRSLTPAVAALVLLSQGVPSGSRAADLPSVDGWSIRHLDAKGSCLAEGPSEGQAQIAIVATGPLFQLLVRAPDFPSDETSHPLELSFDGKPSVHGVGMGAGQGVVVFNIGLADSGTLTRSSRFSVTVQGRTHEFPLKNTLAAFDAVAQCAGQIPLSERKPPTEKPVPGGGKWVLTETLAGLRGRACSARVTGDQIDTILLLNQRGDLVLMGGHGDWATWGGEVPLELSIDGSEPTRLKASTVNNLILVSVTDPALLQRLRAARTLDWSIPTGRVRGDVTGLGVALDALKQCSERKP